MSEEEKKLKMKEALIDYNLASRNLIKRRFTVLKRILIVFGIFLGILVLVRNLYGEIYFSLPYMYYNQSNEFKFFVNGEQKNISFEDYKDITIIPGVLYFRRFNMGGWYNVEKYDEDLFFETEKVVLDFEVYECYTQTDNVRVSCDSFEDKLIRKEVEPEFKSIFIRKNGGNNEVMYDGEYISDISDYVKEKAYYYIEIMAEYDGVETKLYLTPRRKVSVE